LAEDVEHLLVAFGVLVEDAVGGPFGERRHLAAESLPLQGPLEPVAHDLGIGARSQAQHGVVDDPVAADPLRRSQAGEHSGELSLGAAEFAAAGAGDEEEFRRSANPDVVKNVAARETKHSARGKVVVGREAPLENGDGSPFVRSAQRPAGFRVDAVDPRPMGAERRPDDFGRDEQRFLTWPLHFDLGRDPQPLLHPAYLGRPKGFPHQAN
jgi:hypothetical protein